MKETEKLKTALESAYANLENNRLLINSLNVFPVPDGDTGDNMCMTFKSGLDRIKQKEYETDEEMIADFSLACLMGARGNSGVILSLATKGFASAFRPRQSGGEYLVKGFQNAVELCYKSVSSPKEGTALTVLRSCADKAAKVSVMSGSLKKIFSEVYVTATATLAKTKELLPELKEANVVDSGAKGLVCLMEGIRLFLEENKVYELNNSEIKEEHKTFGRVLIENKFCCECIIKSENKIELSELESLGDSAISAASDGIIKIHVHSNCPEKVLTLAQNKGEIVNVKIENMEFQHNSASWGAKKKYAFIAVSMGDGISECFNQLGCDRIITSKEKISAGQASKAIAELNAETVFILPNDKNNLLAFKQAVKMSDTECVIVETEDPAQGIWVMMNFDSSLSSDENKENILSSMSQIKTGKICIADKPLKKIKKGDSIGIIEDKIEVCTEDTFSCMEKVVEKLCDKDYNDISVFCGKTVNESVMKKAEESLNEKHKKSQINVINGGQDIYDYIVMVSQ